MKGNGFRLGGKKYHLTRDEVEERLRHVLPKPIEKYSVTVNQRAYPPKQVLAVALNKPLVSFTTMDANRILATLGFELQKAEEKNTVLKTESEQLFEEYLNSCGLTDFRFEGEFEETSKRPDYTLTFHDEEILFELKEFHATKDDFRPGGGAYDPYRPIREKIGAARKKFQDLEKHCCCLVLYNREKPLVHLEWRFIYGAMLGNLGFRIPFDPSRGLTMEEARPAYLYGGKMHSRYNKDGYPTGTANNRISAILVLGQFDVGYRRFQSAVLRRERELGQKLTFEEHWTMIDRARGTERDVSLTQLRVIVHENPYAAKKLSHIFCGPYDERYGHKDGRIERIFAGEEILMLEANTANRDDTSVS